jgi:putative transcriptional regulator
MIVTPGIFLVASPALVDPHFQRTVVFLVEHGEEGSLGFVINRGLDLQLSELWADCPEELGHHRIAAQGGPVEPNKGLLLHGDGTLAGTTSMGHGIHIGGDLTRLIARWANGPDRQGPRLLLGHSGWGPGQLAEELDQGAWIVRPGDPTAVFDRASAGEHFWRRLSDGGNRRLPTPSLN